MLTISTVTTRNIAIKSERQMLSRYGGFLRHAARHMQIGESRHFSRGTVVMMARTSKDKEGKDLKKDTVADEKARLLDMTLANINSKFGKNSVMRMSDGSMDVESFPTGALTLDVALGGGWPKGRIVEIFGPESSGKTTLALHAMAEVQKAGGTVVLVDAEHAFDPTFAQNVGVDVDSLLISQPESGEDALEIVDQLIRSGTVSLIAVDSVAALVPKAELEGEIGQANVGQQARLMSQAMRKLPKNASRFNCTVLFLNQLRKKIGVLYGNPEVTAGGEALKYFSSIRVDLRRKEAIKGQDADIGIRVKANVKKNKVAAPHRLAEFDILFGSGISSLGCLLDAAEAVKVVERRGSWYYFGDSRLSQGRERTMEIVKESEELRSKIESETRAVLSGRNINQLYQKDSMVVDEVYAEGEGVLRTPVVEEEGAEEAEEEKY